MTTSIASRTTRLTILAAAAAAVLIAPPSPATAAAPAARVPHCDAGDPAARSDPRCAVDTKLPPGVGRGAPSSQGQPKPGAAPRPATDRFEASAPGPLPGGGYLRLGAPADPRTVSTVQRRLTRAGFPVHRDGRYGPRTAAAVRRFQTEHGLLVDAIVGRQTDSALRHDFRTPTPQTPATQIPPSVGQGGAARTRTRVLRAVTATTKRMTFDVHSLPADRIVSATMKSGRRTLRVNVARLRGAARRGHAGVRLVRRAGKPVAIVSAVRAPRRTAAGTAAARRAKRLSVVVADARPGTAPSASSPTGAATRQIAFGAWTPGDPYNNRTDGADALQAATGRHVDIVNWYQNWGGGDWISSVQAPIVNAVSGGGRSPLITWEPWAPGAGANQPTYALSKIAGGDFDAYITTWAVALRALGHTVYLRPMHEMNGNWYPWSGATNGGSPALYIAAWRRMHDIFTRIGATNVRWVWAPSNVDVPDVSSNRMEAFYPGSSYVDILGVDGYNWGSGVAGGAGWQSFSQVFSDAYNRLSALGSQPIWITEVGGAPQGGDKSAWVRDMFAKAQGMSRLEAIVWFNEDKERDWRAAPSSEVASAFAPPVAGARSNARPR